MSPWHPQHFEKEAFDLGGVSNVIRSALAVGESIVAVHPDLTPVFTLRHLAHLTDVPYNHLRDVVARTVDPYRSFRIAKSVAESIEKNYRLISVPDFLLLKCQRWLAKNVLAYGRTDPASAAYARNCDIKTTASLHCESRWLIKLDIKGFLSQSRKFRLIACFDNLVISPL